MPVLTYPATTPRIFAHDPSDLVVKTVTNIAKTKLPATSPLKVGIGGGGALRPSTGQVYPRGDQ